MMLERMKGGERKEEVLKQEYTDESMMAAGFTFLFICMGNARGFDAFMGMDEGDRGKGRGPCKSESYKVLNLAFFYSVTNSESKNKI